MARFFQHIEPGSALGKVTRLKYIDDISDDDMILYYFEDGTYCNKDVIAPVDYTVEDYDTIIRDKKVMVELAGPNYAWSLMQKEVVPETKAMYKDEVTGEVYEIVGRDVETNGTRESAQINSVAKKHNRIELKLPRKPSRFNQEEDDNYLLSEHPELENGATPVQAPTQQTSFLKKRQPQIQKPSADFDFDAETATPDTSVPVQQTTPVQKKQTLGSMKLEAKTLTMDIEKLPATNVCIKTANSSETISLEEFKKRLAVSSDTVEKLKTEAAQKLPFDRCIEEEDVLIKNMIDKSKKKTAKITLAVSIPLPPKEVYETIKDVYEEGMADEFVKSVTARISMDKLLESLSEGMKKFYEGSSSKTTENANK